MRYLILCFVALSLLIIPCGGCGSSRPDPRDNPDFVDDTDPNVTLQQMGGEDTGPGAAENQE